MTSPLPPSRGRLSISRSRRDLKAKMSAKLKLQTSVHRLALVREKVILWVIAFQYPLQSFGEGRAKARGEGFEGRAKARGEGG